MDAARRAVLLVLNDHPTLLVDAALVSARARGGATPFAQRDIEQLMRGFGAVMVEALEGASTADRALFVDTAVGGLMASGRDVGSLLAGVAAFGVTIAHALLPRVDAQHRDAAAAWLSRFFHEYAQCIVDAAKAPR